MTGLPKLPYVDIICETCQQGKQARFSFSPSISQTTDILQVIHSDVCGPIKKPSFNGARYFVIFTDDYSRKLWVSLIKTKDRVIDEFKKFKNRIENQTRKKSITLRTDNGTEYMSTAFQQLLIDSSIHHELTQYYTPQSNGVSERKNRSIVEMARCLCFQHNIPSYLWSEAIKTATYIINRVPTRVLTNMTPKEAFSGMKPDLSQLRTFGTRIFVHTPKEKR